MTDLILAIAHHLAVFTLVGIFAVEVGMLQPGIGRERINRLGAVDAAYGAVAGLVVIIGIIRVIFGDSGWEYYVFNWVFWAKMVAFLAMGLLSIPPTRAIAGWRKIAKDNAGFVLDSRMVGAVRRFHFAQIVALVFIPAFAAAMARGYGI
jgi:putative membrane protein